MPLEEHIEECLDASAFPESHRRRIRTTNGLERLNQEIKRRTRVVRIFPNRTSCLRLVSALAVEQSEEWVTGRRYLDMQELEEYLLPGAAGRRGGCAHGALEEASGLEETTEIQDLTPDHGLAVTVKVRGVFVGDGVRNSDTNMAGITATRTARWTPP